MKKGQSTLEYLITYGWAILIIVVIAAILWYFGVFNPSRWAGKQATGFTRFVVDDFTVTNKTPDGLANVTMLMGSLNDKTITNITITACQIGDTCASVANYSNNSWSPTERKTVTILNATNSTVSIGDDYRIQVNITYKLSGVQHVDSGFITGKVE